MDSNGPGLLRAGESAASGGRGTGAASFTQRYSNGIGGGGGGGGGGGRGGAGTGAGTDSQKCSLYSLYIVKLLGH